MSGTSFDGVDVSLIKTDGRNYVKHIYSASEEYSEAEKKIYNSPFIENYHKIKDIINFKHKKAIKQLINRQKIDLKKIDIIGLHGQTIKHKPSEGWSWQYINPKYFLNEFRTKIITDFRLKDINNGGDGAPIVPYFHHIMIKRLQKISYPIALINIGGVSNATIITDKNTFFGYDIGPGNGPLDSITTSRLKINMDKDGFLATKGSINYSLANEIINYIKKMNQKSFDRNELDNICLEKTNNLNTNDALATISFVISELIIFKLKKFRPKKMLLLGGGRKNLAIKSLLEKNFKGDVLIAEQLNFDGDSFESQAIAYLAVRSFLGLEYTFKETTNVRHPVSGGVLHNCD